MLHYLLELNTSAILLQLFVIFVSWVLVLFAVGIDLHFGIAKSREDGIQVTHSRGIRLTYMKVKEYLAIMFFMLFLDILNPIFTYFAVPTAPLFSVGGAIVLIWTEWKSVKEKKEDKFRKVGDSAYEIMDYLRRHKEELEEFKKLAKR